MQGVNAYWQQLKPEEIANNVHRHMIGGLWDEVGAWQFDLLRSQGLKPHHRLVDVGCGSLRGGLHFIPYLDVGHYCGLDINTSLIEAGWTEVRQASLEERQPRLLVDDGFRIDRFRVPFDFALAVSVFTHLFANHLLRCLREVRKGMAPGGRFFATYFEAPTVGHCDSIPHHPGGVVTHLDSDPFHYSFEEMRQFGAWTGFSVSRVEHAPHPRSQQMLCFQPVA